MAGGKLSLYIFKAFQGFDLDPIGPDPDTSLSSIVSWQQDMEGAR